MLWAQFCSNCKAVSSSLQNSSICQENKHKSTKINSNFESNQRQQICLCQLTSMQADTKGSHTPGCLMISCRVTDACLKQLCISWFFPQFSDESDKSTAFISMKLLDRTRERTLASYKVFMSFKSQTNSQLMVIQTYCRKKYKSTRPTCKYKCTYVHMLISLRQAGHPQGQLEVHSESTDIQQGQYLTLL